MLMVMLELLVQIQPGQSVLRNRALPSQLVGQAEIHLLRKDLADDQRAHPFVWFARGGEGPAAGVLFPRAQRVAELAARSGLPAMYELRQYVDAGGLISYGPNIIQIWRQAAGFVDKIIKGAKPSDLPIEQPTKFELVINLKAAKALGLRIPQALLLRADELIE